MKPFEPARRDEASVGTWLAPGLRAVPRAEGRGVAERRPVAPGFEARAVPADGLLPRAAFALRPKNRDPDEERERFCANGLRLPVDAVPDRAPVVPRPEEDAPVDPTVPRLARYQLDDEPEDERGLRKFEEPDEDRGLRKLEELRALLDPEGMLRAPENAFDRH